MKKIVLTLFVLSFLACKKVNTSQENFTGTWEYIQTTTGYTVLNDALPAGNGNLIVLSSGGEFKRMKHDTLIYKGTYNIEMRSECYDKNLKPVLETSENFFNGNNRFMSIDPETGWLTLSVSKCINGGSTIYYRRVQ